MEEERLVVALEARIAEFEKRMKKAEQTGTRSYTRLRQGSKGATAAMQADMVRSTGRINQALASTTSQIGIFSKAFVGGLVGGAVTAAFATFTTNLARTVRGVASIGDEARRAGVSAEAFQEWAFVAERNRIGVDQMTDGLKELNLRADEFITTGSGPAAEAFQRLGYSAEELARGLEDPSELLLDIIQKMGELDTAARIRVADEVFGGSAGERFVELVDQGADGLRRTMDRAHEVGAVMDEEMIAKAAELDRRWGELTTRASTFFRTVAVETADAVDGIVAMRTELDQLFDSADGATNVLGEDVAEALEGDPAAVSANAVAIGELKEVYDDLNDRGQALIPILEQASIQLRAWDYTSSADSLVDVAEAMRDLTGRMDDGTISASDFEDQMRSLLIQAKGAFSQIDAIDLVEFSNVTSALGGLIDRLVDAATAAATFRANLPGGGEIDELARTEDPRGDTGNMSGYGDYSTGTDLAPRVVTPPQSRPTDMDWNYNPAPSGGGSPGGGGSAPDEGLSPWFTPEQEAIVLDAYDQVTQAQEAYNEQVEAGALAVADLFISVLDGSKSAKEAVADLLMQLAKVQIQKAVLGLSGGGMGGIFGALGGAMSVPSFDGGGYTGNGARTGGIDGQGGFPAVLHPNETVVDHSKGGTTGAQQQGGRVELVVKAAEGVTVDVVRNEAAIIVQQGIAQYDRQLPGRVRQINADPRRR